MPPSRPLVPPLALLLLAAECAWARPPVDVVADRTLSTAPRCAVSYSCFCIIAIEILLTLRKSRIDISFELLRLLVTLSAIGDESSAILSMTPFCRRCRSATDRGRIVRLVQCAGLGARCPGTMALRRLNAALAGTATRVVVGLRGRQQDERRQRRREQVPERQQRMLSLAMRKLRKSLMTSDVTLNRLYTQQQPRSVNSQLLARYR